MKKPNLKSVHNIYMIGIKGVGMIPVAQILKKAGHQISGCDAPETFFTDAVLKREKIKFHQGFKKSNIPKDIDLVIHSSAYNSKNNAEMAEVEKRKIPMITQAQALAELFNNKYGIAVCGSHGKTTTAALLAFVLHEAGLKPTAAIGSCVPQFKGNAIVGKNDIMVIEADEYQNKLKLYKPKVAVLNNIDYDHPDYFKTPAAYRRVFADFVKRIPDDGFVVANFNDKDVVRAVKGCWCKIIYYNEGKVTSPRLQGIFVYKAEDIKNGYQYFKLWQGKKSLGKFKMQLIGKHNVQNAVAVIVTALQLGVKAGIIKKALVKFRGTARRMEVLGKYNGALFIDDYAHHPTEIKATLSAVKQKYASKNIICAFMPHTYTRTKALFNDFAKSFGDADEVIILPIYGSAREKHGGVSSEDLLKKIRSDNARIAPSMKKCAEYLKKKVDKNDIVILMGAGDTFRVWDYFKKL